MHVFLLDLISSSRKSAWLRLFLMVALLFPAPAIILLLTAVNHKLVGLRWVRLPIILPQSSIMHTNAACVQSWEKILRENDLFTVIYLILLMQVIVSQSSSQFIWICPWKKKLGSNAVSFVSYYIKICLFTWTRVSIIWNA